MLKKFICLAALAAVCGVGQAQTPEQKAVPTEAKEAVQNTNSSAQEKELDRIRKLAQGRLGVQVKHVLPSPIPGLYELAVNNEIIYMDPTGDHVLMGEIFNTLTRKNLTQEAKDKLLTIDFSSLPLADAIKTVHGNGSRQIAVFSDPNCSFCKKLEASLAGMKDVTIYTFLYPVITAGSKEASANIWCSKDRALAWKQQLLEGKAAPKRAANCDISALDRNIELGSKLNITGTPTVFVPSGKRAPGAVGIDYLENLLSEAPQHP